MNKRLLTPLFLLTCLSFSACGKKTVKVTLKGDEHLTWEKTEDKAELNKDYVVYSKCDKGYILYDGDDTLQISINEVPVTKDDYKMDESTQKLTILSNSIKGDIIITAKSSLTISKFTLVVPSDCYKDLSTTSYEINIEHPNIEYVIRPNTGKTLKDTITVDPSDLKYSYDKINEEGYKLTVKQEELYRDITITLPTL